MDAVSGEISPGFWEEGDVVGVGDGDDDNGFAGTEKLIYELLLLLVGPAGTDDYQVAPPRRRQLRRSRLRSA